MHNIHIFFHVATMGNWSFVFDEIYSELQKSKILQSNNFHLNVTGSNFNKNLSYIYRGNINEFEFPTLNDIWILSQKQPDAKILYLHTKGATKNDPNVDDWRKYMLYFNIGCWTECIEKLQNYDAVGVNKQTNGYGLHYSGNFWWANASYIKSLPNPNLYKKDRLMAEFWLGLNNGNFATLHDSHINHYTTRYPESKYQKEVNS